MKLITQLRNLEPARADALLAVALLAAAQAEIWWTPAAADDRAETAVAATLMTLPLAWRRRRPFASILVVMSAVLGLAIVAELPNVVFLLPIGLIATYSLGAYASAEHAVLGLGLTLVSLAVSAVRTEDPTITDLTAPVVLFTASWAGGRTMRSRRLRDAEMEDRTATILREQQDRERLAAAEERRRIARELHDIVAHRVTTIVIQAESGAATADEPERSVEAFRTVAECGRQALEELRRLLGLLRSDDEAIAITPQPGLRQLDDLVAGAVAAGMPVDVRLDGDLDELPAGVELTAYRIVQEALTNALRHGRTKASVRISRDDGQVTVQVRNPITGGSRTSTAGAGLGLAGMRERIRVYDGDLTARAVGAEWVVDASLPVTESGP